MKISYLLALVAVLLVEPGVRGAEIASNRAGGGPWSDPATWRGNKVPGPADDVVIQKHDIIIFDRNDDGKTTCQKLQIDPKGGLTFKKGAGKVVCCIANEIENFGAIRVDAANSAGDFFELRLSGDKAEKRKLKVMKGGGLLLYGRPGPAAGQPNVVLTAPKNEKQEPVAGSVEAAEGSMLEVRHAQVHDINLQASKIDNTGARANERLNFMDSRFTGQARIYLHTCDTPVIVRNSFDWRGEGQLPWPAISVNASPLAEVKDNVIRGNFAQGITMYANNEVAVIGNKIEKCGIGIYSFYSLNSMIKNCTTQKCEVGVGFYSATGTVEDVTIENALTGLSNFQSTVQATTVEIKGLDKKGQAILHDGGGMTLLNCNITPSQVKLIVQKPSTDPAAKPPPIPIIAFHFLIVGVKGAVPGAVVDVRTTVPALPAGAADPNVRNSPAPLTDGLTPLPRTLTPLIVKGWTMDLKGATLPAPEYGIKILGPAAKEGAARPVLKAQAFRPAESMFRAIPNALAANLDVSLK